MLPITITTVTKENKEFLRSAYLQIVNKVVGALLAVYFIL